MTGQIINNQSDLLLFQGVWFPISITMNGVATSLREPTFPTCHEDPWLMSIINDEFHITDSSAYYASGGLIVPDLASSRLQFINPYLTEEWDSTSYFELNNDQLFLKSGGYTWSGVHDVHSTTLYQRVAYSPNTTMLHLISTYAVDWRSLDRVKLLKRHAG